MEEKPNAAVEEGTEAMRTWGGLSQDEMDQCWKNLTERMEEEVLDKYKVEERFRGRGVPLEWRTVRKNNKYRRKKVELLGKNFSLFRVYNLQRLQSKHEESTEVEEMKQQKKRRS